MTPIPLPIRSELEGLDRMKRCARQSLECSGRIEWHHAITGLGRKQIQEVFAIISLCVFHHRGLGKNDEIARHIALQQATTTDFKRYPKCKEGWEQEKLYLQKKYENNPMRPV